MNTDGKIYITISDHKMQDDYGSNNTRGGGNNKKKLGLAEHAVNDFIKSNAQSILYYGIEHYGDFTGNYQTQRDISSLLQVANKALAIGTAFAVGGLIGGGIALATELASNTLQLYSTLVEQSKTNYNIQQLRKISGLNNNSRGTEN